MKPARRLNNLPPLFFADLAHRIAALNTEGADVIRIDIGSPDMPPAPAILDALKHSTDVPSHHGYGGYAGHRALRQAIADYYQRRFGVELDECELYPLAGSKDGVGHIHIGWLNPGDISLIPNPGYNTYASAPFMADACPVSFDLLPERGWRPDFDSIPVETAQKARMLWLNYPNNPTGAVAPLEFLAEAVNFCRRYEILLCSDAPYMDVTFDNYKAHSVLEVPGAKDVAIEFNSLSKIYNMAGWRIGMIVGHAPAVKAVAQVKGQVDSGLATPIQDMAVAALTGEQAWVAERNAIYQHRRDICLETLDRLALEYVRPQAGMYVWFKTPSTQHTSMEWHQQWLTNGHVSITPGSIYGTNGEGWMRISIAVPTERLREAMARLETVVAST